MDDLRERMRRGGVLLADGGLGTMLIEHGLQPGECPESWNLSKPGVLAGIAAAYLEAGAELITTNTFGASPLKLEMHGLGDQAEAINRQAVTAVREAVRDRAYTMASIGPTGRTLKPYGDTELKDVEEAYRRQIAWLAAEGVDLFGIETMTDPTEVRCAIRAAKDLAPGTPLAATMTFDDTPRGFFTIMGVDIPAAAADLAGAGADIIGSNCGNGVEAMIAIARDFRRHTKQPLMIQPNAGLPVMQRERVVYPESPAFMAEASRALLDLGVTVLGGCCGTTPDHIRALREMLPGRSPD
ncbi:MAG: hypothetical protein GF355_03935 [Candidatus Eisenbacteria bacterium]|nr:hypothetical protein [Candidatus Eisenbacteria bacterium]